MPPEWICSQIGAREHYAIPRALHRAQRLKTLCTDFWAGPLLRKIGQPRSLVARYHRDLADVKIDSWNGRSLFWEAGLRSRSRGENAAGKYLEFIDVGRKYASAVREKLRRHPNLSSNTVFFAYDTGALETLEFLRERGVNCIVDQMDPNRVEVAIVREEEKRWPGWALRPTDVPEAYFARREQEWALADRIVVNSEFSRNALIEQGVPANKMTILPLCFENDGTNENSKRERPPFSHIHPLTVLYLGQVLLRKGIQYLIEASKLLRDEPIQIDVVGPIGISQEAIRSAPSNVTFHGRATRDQAANWYRDADVFVLPTLSDGFALTQLEAMTHGLPVIATPNCGEVVTHGQDGFIVQPRDVAGLAQALVLYLTQPALLEAHRNAAALKAGLFDLKRLTSGLISLENTMPGRQNA